MGKCLLIGKQVNAIDRAQEQTLHMSAAAIAIVGVVVVVVSIHSVALLSYSRSIHFTCPQGFPESALKKKKKKKMYFLATMLYLYGGEAQLHQEMCVIYIHVTRADHNHLDVDAHPPTN